MKEHDIDPCTRAMGEITGLSKATLNNLSSKTREMGIPHGGKGRKNVSIFIINSLQKNIGRKRNPSNNETERIRTYSDMSNSSSTSSTLPITSTPRHSVIITPVITNYNIEPYII